MNVLLIYPEFPDTFWSYKHALGFVGKKAAFPPLGLLTIAAMLPSHWNLRLVDRNVKPLRDGDLAWADCAFIGAMVVQRQSALDSIARCRKHGLRIVAGGPLFTTEHATIADVDHFVLNEAELTLPPFLADLAAGTPKPVYATDRFADLTTTPAPMWSLLDASDYHGMAIQYSRGCPFHCDFCNVTAMLGHRVRTKRVDRIIDELDGVYAHGWRGSVFFVDDNFIGNKRRLKTELLPRLTAWRAGKRGITFQTEASIDLADDRDLMDRMVQAGFDTVFVGIETPDDGALGECGKKQNQGRDLVATVGTIQRAGLQVQAGFIVGFDHDEPSVFQRQIDFIQSSGIVTAMVGLLQAPAGTRLYQRLKLAGRLRGYSSGDNAEGTTNIVPVMDADVLRQGYRDLLRHIYLPRHYYARVRTFLRQYGAPSRMRAPRRSDIRAFLQSFYRLGVIGKERVEYWKLLLWTCCRRPARLPLAITMAICGYHFRTVSERHVR